MARYRYDPATGTLYEVGDAEASCGPQVMPDIEPYLTAAGDVAADGKPVVIGGRAQHQEFLRRNNLREVGNDYDKRQVDEGKPRMQTQAEFKAERARRVEAIKRAADMLRAGYRPDWRD